MYMNIGAMLEQIELFVVILNTLNPVLLTDVTREPAITESLGLIFFFLFYF